MPLKITRSGYIRVYRGDTFVSQHTDEPKAYESAYAHAEANGDGDYRITFPERTVQIIVKRQVDGPSVPELGTPYALSFDSVTVPLVRPSTGPSAIASYQIERATSSGGPWTVAATGLLIFGNDYSAYVDGGRLAGTTYYYRAKATDVSGRISGYSATVSGTTSTGAGTRKFNPMWMAQTNQFNTPTDPTRQALIDQEINYLFTLPSGWGGFYMPFQWKDLEPTKGNYNFSYVIQRHNQLWAQGKRLGFSIAVQNFRWSKFYADPATRPYTPEQLTLPDYLFGEGLVTDRTPSGSGHFARMWDATAMGYYISLLQAASAALDGLPGIEWFESPEASFSVLNDSTYSGSALQTQWLRMIRARNTFFPNTVCLCGINYAPTQAMTLEQATEAAANGWGCGGPDTNAGPPANVVSTGQSEIWGHMAWRGAGSYGGYNWGTTDLTNVGATRAGVEGHLLDDQPDQGTAAQVETYMNDYLHAHYKVITLVNNSSWPNTSFSPGWTSAAAAVNYRVNTTRPSNWPA